MSSTIRGAQRSAGRGRIGMVRQLRGYSEKVGEKPVNPHVGFYKTNAGPIAKVLLMATFVYQLTYWGWVKLEKEEKKREMSAEVTALEKQLAGLTKGKEDVKKA